MLSGLGGRLLTSPSGATVSQWISFELQSYRDFQFRRAIFLEPSLADKNAPASIVRTTACLTVTVRSHLWLKSN